MKTKNKRQITFATTVSSILLLAAILSFFSYGYFASASHASSSSPAITVNFAGRQNQNHPSPPIFWD